MLTVEAEVAFGLGKFDLTYHEVQARIEKALDVVGMPDCSQRAVQTLSTVANTGALIEACKSLLLEELTTFLDEIDQLKLLFSLSFKNNANSS
ncbi:ABC transporter I family member 10-like [Silene latifolia]|uniref:ABC transporter I family member 10-like n=1 Tax=Silene latifolia TaxID=37657 RepID=UPI003D7706EC